MRNQSFRDRHGMTIFTSGIVGLFLLTIFIQVGC